jgi:hypothetical protein
VKKDVTKLPRPTSMDERKKKGIGKKMERGEQS